LKSHYPQGLEALNDAFFHDPANMEKRDSSIAVIDISSDSEERAPLSDSPGDKEQNKAAEMTGSKPSASEVSTRVEPTQPISLPLTAPRSHLMGHAQETHTAPSSEFLRGHNLEHSIIRTSLFNYSYVFIPSTTVPFRFDYLNSFKARLRGVAFRGVTADKTGYFIFCDTFTDAQLIHSMLDGHNHNGYALGTPILMAGKDVQIIPPP
jgi:hypothetical protein